MTVLSDFTTDIAAEIDAGDFSEAITYTPVGGVAVAGYAVVDIMADLSGSAGGLSDMASFTVKKALVADPEIYATITYAGNDYVVRQVASGSGAVWLLVCERLRRQLPAGMG